MYILYCMSRLPNPGSDSGVWGDVLNDFLSVEHNPDGTLKASGSLANKVDTTDARLANQVSYYPAQGYGFFSMTDTPGVFTANSSVSSPGTFFVRLWVPAGQTIAVVGTLVQSAGTVSGGGENRFALYDDTGTRLALSPSSNTLWTTTGWVTGTLSSPIAAQTTGRFVYGAFTVNGYSANPKMMFCNTGDTFPWYGGNGVTNRRLIFEGSATTLPASFTVASYGVNTTYMPMIALG